MNTDQSCPRCGSEVMRAWQQLSSEEHEVVERLPESSEFESKERKAMHRWCTRCWYESMEQGGEKA